MAEVEGHIGELRFTVEIKRAASGVTETYELVGELGDIPADEHAEKEL
jgi:hypothetical protein